MKLPLFLVPALLVAGCSLVSVTGSGNDVTLEEDIADFSRLGVSHGFQVKAVQADEFSVVLRIDDSVVESLQVEKDGSTLRIGLESGKIYDLDGVTLEADITMPDLIGLDLAHGSHADLSGFQSANALEADLSSGSHLNGDVEAGDAMFDLTGGSHVTLRGAAGNLTLFAGGGSHANLGNLEVVDADVKAMGGSHVTANVSGTLDSVATGGSHVKYRGTAELGTTDTDVSSSLKKD